MARPIGKRIKQVLAIADALEGATATQIHAYLSTVSNQSVGKYCARAVSLGLLTVKKSGKTGRFCTYWPAEGWRGVVADLDPADVISELVVSAAKQKQPNSVFALGNM